MRHYGGLTEMVTNLSEYPTGSIKEVRGAHGLGDYPHSLEF